MIYFFDGIAGCLAYTFIASKKVSIFTSAASDRSCPVSRYVARACVGRFVIYFFGEIAAGYDGFTDVANVCVSGNACASSSVSCPVVCRIAQTCIGRFVIFFSAFFADCPRLTVFVQDNVSLFTRAVPDCPRPMSFCVAETSIRFTVVFLLDGITIRFRYAGVVDFNVSWPALAIAIMLIEWIFAMTGIVLRRVCLSEWIADFFEFTDAIDMNVSVHTSAVSSSSRPVFCGIA